MIIKFSLFLFPAYFVLFIAGGCSHKYIDPQYYKFKRFYKDDTFIVYDEQLFKEVKILINKKAIFIKNIKEDIEYDNKMQELYLKYRQKNIKNKDQQISEWE